MLYSVLVSIDVLIAAGLIGLVLIQQGKGANAGAAFGSGASGTVFGARGSASFLTRATAILAALFFINSLVLAYLASNRPVSESVMDSASQVQEQIEAGDGMRVLPGDADIEDIKEEIKRQIENNAAGEQDSGLPADVPGFTEELTNESVQTIDKIPDTAQEKGQAAADEAAQSLPEDVPQ